MQTNISKTNTERASETIHNYLKQFGVFIDAEEVARFIEERPVNSEQLNALASEVADMLMQIAAELSINEQHIRIVNTSFNDCFIATLSNISQALLYLGNMIDTYLETANLKDLTMLRNLVRDDIRHNLLGAIGTMRKLLNSDTFALKYKPGGVLTGETLNDSNRIEALYYRTIPVELYGNNDSLSQAEVIPAIRDYSANLSALLMALH